MDFSGTDRNLDSDWLAQKMSTIKKCRLIYKALVLGCGNNRVARILTTIVPLLSQLVQMRKVNSRKSLPITIILQVIVFCSEV